MINDEKLTKEIDRLNRIVEALAVAIEHDIKDNDYCPVCDNHPSHGHAHDCELAEYRKRAKP